MAAADVLRDLPRTAGDHLPRNAGEDRLRRYVDDLITDELRRLRQAPTVHRVRKVETYATLPEFIAMRDSGRQNLDRYERALQHLFENGVKLGYLQKKFIAGVRLVSLHRMFGAKLLENMAFLEREFGIDRVERAACILFPRRSGKTTVECVDCAVTLVSQPDGNCVCLNLTGRQSSAWLTQCIGYLELFQNSNEFAWTEVARKMPERITIRVASLGTDNTVMSFPGAQAGSFDNLRGMGIRLAKVYLDEAAFFDERVMPVMGPLLVNGAALILTSSIAPGGARVGLMKILDATYPDGKLAVLEINMNRACKICTNAGKDPSGGCEHNATRPQHFQTQSDIAFVEALLSPWAGAADRELHNKNDKPLIEPAFKHGVDLLRDRSRDVDVSSQDHRFVYVTIDPAAMGASSQATLLTALKMPPPPGVQRRPGDPDSLVLLSGDVVDAQFTADLIDMVARHLTAVWARIPEVRNALFVIDIEANYGQVANDVQRGLTERARRDGNLPRFMVMLEDTRKRTAGMAAGLVDGNPIVTAGSRTTNKLKVHMVEVLNQLLRGGHIYFARQFVQGVAAPPGTASNALTTADVREQISTEMGNYKRETIVTKPNKNSTRTPSLKVTFSGKYALLRDDWVSALGAITVEMETFWRSDRYVSFRGL